MKKLFFITLFLVSLNAVSQTFPITQNIGSKPTNVHTPGIYTTNTGFGFYSFQDTTAANIPSYLSFTPGAVILVAYSQLWVRNSTVTQWVQISGGGTSTSTFASFNFFDTISVRKIIDGTVNTRDNAFPSVIQMNNGNLLLGYWKGYNHAISGIPSYRIITGAGTVIGAEVNAESSFARNWDGFIPSKMLGDTILGFYTDSQFHHISRRYSVDNAVTWSTKDSINSSDGIKYICLGQGAYFAGLNIIPFYTQSPSARCGVIVSPNVRATTWDTIFFSNGSTFQLSESSKPIVDGDSVILFLRSDVDNLDTLYRTASANGRTWTTPVAVTITGGMAAKPEVQKMLDGRYLINYRHKGSPPFGVIWISSNKGLTWDSLYQQGFLYFSYGALQQMGQDKWICFHGSILAGPGYGDIWRDYYHIPRLGLNNLATNFEPNGTSFKIDSMYIADKIAASSGASLVFSTDKAGTDAHFTYTYPNVVLSIPEASSTTTGTITPLDQVIGSVGFTKTFQSNITASAQTTVGSFLQTGAPIFRVQNSGGADPTGAAGSGLELFQTAGIAWIQSYNPTSGLFEALKFRGTSYNFPDVGNSHVYIEEKLGIGTTVPTQSLTVNGQVRINTINNASVFDSVIVVNDGVLEARLASSIVGATPGLQSVITANGTLTTNNTITNGANTLETTFNSLTGPSGGSSFGFAVSSNGTAATDGQTLFVAQSQGANSASSVTSYAAKFQNLHSGTSSTNVSGYFNSNNGATNYSIIVPPGGGSIGFGTTTPTSTLQVVGSFATAIVTKTANYTATISDYIIKCSTNTFQITLPTAVGIDGRIYVVKNITSGTTITVATTSSQTIDGVTTKTINTQYSGITVVSDGANWNIIGTF